MPTIHFFRKTVTPTLLVLFCMFLSACATLQSRPHTAMGVVLQWNELALASVRNEVIIRPTVVARQLFLLHAAMYDAWSAFDPRAKPYALDPGIKMPEASTDEAAKTAAVSQAAYHILHKTYPRFDATGAYQQEMARLGLLVVNKGDPKTPAGIGYLAAQAVMEARADDGSNAANNYEEITSAIYPRPYAPVNSDDPRSNHAPGHAGFDPNHWQPLRVPYAGNPRGQGRFLVDDDNPNSYNVQVFMTPHWGAVKPFALSSGDQFRPPPPPHVGSDEPYTDATGKQTTNDQSYRDQVAEILRLNAGLTDRQKVMAEFWADGPRSESPPGHWNQLAHGLSVRDKHTLDDDVKMFFALNAALFDAGIAVWDSKRYYDYVRPKSAIQYLYLNQTVRGWGGPNRGAVSLLGQDWQPFQQQTFITPNFPEYLSGHSVFSAAAATVLTLFTGTDRFYDGVTRTGQDIDQDGDEDLLGEFIFRAGAGFYERGPAEDVVLRWSTLKEASDEAALSRRYGGIHFQDSDLRGRLLGRQVGEAAFIKARSYWE
ncbi:MAG: vanadium-dependent haloperoxidase [Gammaproteobacteria bacterium]|nr:vanadium-dependent haloperoxidase [Gammaproteobacteria bacterium]MCP5425140.1 vanadium-dependent haloperoxidase [Gammaproteobacteria bacterium]MCP5459827.1 vanadium-dependent haloperoxidase [Gammaproteobacteria bacterium]